jgi:hypothetical protein
MDLSKLGRGEKVAAIGGIVLLFALLFLNWYGIGGSIKTPIGDFSIGAEFGAWDAQGFLGTLANLVILAAGVAAVGLAFVTATSRTVALPVAASAVTTALGIAAVVMILGRMLFQPGQNDFVDLELGIFVALAGALAVACGGWLSMQEEGTSFDQARDQLGDRFRDRDPGGGPPVPPPPPHEGPPPAG